MEPRIPRCNQTGVTLPECHCRQCADDLIRRHAPHIELVGARLPDPRALVAPRTRSTGVPLEGR